MSVYVGQRLFRKARLAAVGEVVLARLRRKPAALLPFEPLIHLLQGCERIRLPHSQSIPLSRIAGSTGRHRDFTRKFRPRHAIDAERWVRLDVAMAGLQGLSPIEVFQIGNVYFVADGNHRVSVARASGFEEIDAYVTVIRANVDLEADDSLAEAILKIERARFLAQTRLVEQGGQAGIAFRKPGGYRRMLAEIADYQATGPTEAEAASSLAQAAAAWYANIYQPTTRNMPPPGLVDRLRRRTTAERYLARQTPQRL